VSDETEGKNNVMLPGHASLTYALLPDGALASAWDDHDDLDHHRGSADYHPTQVSSANDDLDQHRGLADYHPTQVSSANAEGESRVPPITS
jgi:hypothetical protein